jgi:hypothetical protein
MKIILHIERLVLDGLAVTSMEGAQVRAAVEHELAAMLSRGGLSHALRQGGAVPRVGAPQIALGARPRPGEIGRKIAQSVHHSIGAVE